MYVTPNVIPKRVSQRISKPLKVKYNGSLLVLYPVRYLLTSLKLARRTLTFWEKNKIIPTPLFKPAGYIRFYSEIEIRCYKEAYDMVRLMKKDVNRTAALRRSMSVAQSKILKYYKIHENKQT